MIRDHQKVSSTQLYAIWKNLSIGLLTIVAVMVLSIILPYYLSPLVALAAAAILYTVLYNSKLSHTPNCMLIPYAVFLCIISYSFITIVINVLYIWGVIWLPREFTFFYYPYLPSLLLDPICLVTMIILWIRQRKISICINCKIENGHPVERGKYGNIVSYESHLQIKNLTILFAVITSITWAYYLLIYINDGEINNRDWYVFGWLLIIAFVADEIYFIFRYYNLYLDLKENDEIITQEELQDMVSQTFLRFYVVCGDKVFLDPKMSDPGLPYRHVIDSPFYTSRSVTGITVAEVGRIIERMTGVDGGELRFFYGRRMSEVSKSNTLRYFYFIDETPDGLPELNVEGKWYDFDDVKHIYNYNPGECSSVLLSDITRMATIVLTQKTFNEQGFRKNKIKSYRPSFNLKEIREGGYDFQDDKWIRISVFNSDTKMYRLKRWWRGIMGNSKENSKSWN